LKRIALSTFGLLVLAIFTLLLWASLQKPDYSVSQSLEIGVPQNLVYNSMSNLQLFEKWSPWHGLDPQMTVEVSGAAGSIGSSFKWKGNSSVGEGEMTITDTQPPSKISLKIHFKNPVESQTQTHWTLEPIGEGKTKVTWVMTGQNETPFRRLFAMVFNMNKMLREQFLKGLGNLKTFLESQPT
jgi:uncharacterized protein YndB with AHSA1/START domain